MRIQIAARKCDIPDSVRSRTEEQLGKLSKYEPHLAAADVVFETEKHRKKVEAILNVGRGDPVVAGGEGAEFQDALDSMVDRLTRMLKRRRSQKTDYHGRGIEKPVPIED